MGTILGNEQEQQTTQNIDPGTDQAQDVQKAAVPAQEITFDKMVGADGAMAEGWKTLLPEDIRDEPSLNNIKHISALAKSYVCAQKAVGANKITLPSENATPEEWGEVYKALGRPETADKYEFKPAEDLPEGLKFDDTLLKNFQKEAHDLGLNQKQYDALVNYQAKMVAEQMRANELQAEAEYNGTLQKLKTEYGATLPQVVAQCNKAIETFGFTKILADHGLLNNYDVIKAFASLGEKISESKLKGAENLDQVNDAKARLQAIMGNMDDPYFKREHPQHNQRVQEVAALMARTRGGKG